MSVETKNKANVEPPPNSDDSHLKEGWAAASLSRLLVSLESGSRPRGGVRGITEGVPSIGGEHLNYDGTFNFEAIKYVPHDFAEAMTKGRIRENDVLVVKDGATTGKTAFVSSTFPHSVAFVNEHVFICRPTNQIEPKFLFRFLMSKEGQDRILENFKGSAQGGINQTFAPNVIVPTAPLAEQRRIVAKLDEVLGNVSSSQQRLARIPALLKRFRQSVLAAACSGKLTADWREQNQKVVSYQSKDIGNGTELEDEIPLNWTQTTLRPLIQVVTSGSRGWAEYYSDSGSLFIRAQNINSDVLKLDDIAFVALPNKAEGLRTRVQKHDLLVTITGANVTKSAIVNIELDDAYVSQHVALLRLKDHKLAKFVYLWIICPNRGRKQLLESAYGQGKPGLNLDNIRDVAISIPPIPEQHEIVRRVEQLFIFADQIETRLKKAQAQVERLTQSVLAKAFRGELVPTEAELARRENRSYEPASELLARIQADRDKGCASTKTTTKKRNVTRK